MRSLLLAALLPHLLLRSSHAQGAPEPPEEALEAIEASRSAVERLIHDSVSGVGSGQAWSRLADFTDTIGNRLAGSASLEMGIDYLLDFFAAEGFARGAEASGDRVYTEDAMVPHWVRGEEWAKLKQPLIGDREWDLTMLGLGGSVGTIGQPTATPSGSIEAEVVVFRSMEEMQANAADVAGRIVLVKEEWAGYRTTVRRSLNVEAAKLGAVAALIKSVGPFSLDSPHTGATGHPEGQVLSSIPTAALSVEYAEMLLRMYERCSSPAGCLRLELYMEVRALDGSVRSRASLTPKVSSGDVQPARHRHALRHGPVRAVAEHHRRRRRLRIPGRDRPALRPPRLLGRGVRGDGRRWRRLHLAPGLLDAQYARQPSSPALSESFSKVGSNRRLLRSERLNIRPLRTVRCVGWTSEEMGSQGSRQYWADHRSELDRFSAVFESDGGVFETSGIGLSASLE